MIKVWENSLLIFEDDLKSKSWLDWIKAHTSGSKPLHRYEGSLKLSEEYLSFEGKDIKENRRISLKIPIKNIIGIHYGFDDLFKARDERSPWNKPIRIEYISNDTKKKVYVFADFGIKHLIRTSKNKEFYESLREMIRR